MENNLQKKAFTLFELILVVIIIGLVYSLVLGKITNKKNIEVQNLKDLKKILIKNNINKLLVYDKCKKTKPYNINPELFKDIQVYTVINDNIEKVEFNPIKIKEEIYDVCLKFDINKNQSSSSYIIKQNDKYFVFHPYFQETKVFDNEDEAINNFVNKKEKDEYKNEI